jgi:hypothetical protein
VLGGSRYPPYANAVLFSAAGKQTALAHALTGKGSATGDGLAIASDDKERVVRVRFEFPPRVLGRTTRPPVFRGGLAFSEYFWLVHGVQYNVCTFICQGNNKH